MNPTKSQINAKILKIRFEFRKNVRMMRKYQKEADRYSGFAAKNKEQIRQIYVKYGNILRVKPSIISCDVIE